MNNYQNTHFLDCKIPPVLVCLVCAGLQWFTHALYPLGFSLPATLWWLLVILFMISGVLGIQGVMQFIKAKTTIHPVHINRASQLVTNGVYCFSRNPMYLAMFIWLLMVTIYLVNPLTLTGPLLYVWYMNRFQIQPEERLLNAKFGDEYTAYCQTTRRWL